MDIKLLKNVQVIPVRRNTNKYVKKILGYIFITTVLSISIRADARQTGNVDPQKSLMSVAINWYCSSIGLGCSAEN
ncbi:hypothetical protein [Aliikangiella sp. IMCC44359]|uniref:hypothetical protein n=1 Tax=Aliikangiella sp. IMCC44359 TaxID=3459125 RepID=UPI00403B2D74